MVRIRLNSGPLDGHALIAEPVTTEMIIIDGHYYLTEGYTLYGVSQFVYVGRQHEVQD